MKKLGWFSAGFYRLFLLFYLADIIQNTLQTSEVSSKSLLMAMNKVRSTDAVYFRDEFIKKELEKKAEIKTGGVECKLKGYDYYFKELCTSQFEGLYEYMRKDRRVPRLHMDLGLSYIMYHHIKRLADANKPLTSVYKDKEWGTPELRFKNVSSTKVGYYQEIFFTTSVKNFTAEHLISFLLLDEGDPQRKGRKAIFDTHYRKVGIAVYSPDKENDKKMYLGVLLTIDFDCTLCPKLTCSNRAEVGYSDFLKDIHYEDRCKSGILEIAISLILIILLSVFWY